jgi:hypothetical protein
MPWQGFECHAMDGLKGLLQKMRAMRTEAASMLLPPQGCSTGGLVQRMIDAFGEESIMTAARQRFGSSYLNSFMASHVGFAEVYAIRP